jgi:hypothetical protein
MHQVILYKFGAHALYSKREAHALKSAIDILKGAHALKESIHTS